MKHRLLAFALALIALLLLPLPARAEAAQPAVIKDAAGLLAMAQQPDANYVLDADIDMRGVEWTPFAFTGNLDGAGHEPITHHQERQEFRQNLVRLGTDHHGVG